MHQLGAGKDELLNVEMLQFAQHPLGPTDGDLFVQRTRLARERIIGGEMNHRGNTISVAITNPLEGRFHARVGTQIDADALCFGRWVRIAFPVETDELIVLCQPLAQSAANKAAAASNEDDVALR